MVWHYVIAIVLLSASLHSHKVTGTSNIYPMSCKYFIIAQKNVIRGDIRVSIKMIKF